MLISAVDDRLTDRSAAQPWNACTLICKDEAAEPDGYKNTPRREEQCWKAYSLPM